MFKFIRTISAQIALYLDMALKYSVTFVLMQTKVRNKPTTLRCYVRFNGERSPFKTDVKVEPRYFDKEKCRAVVTSRFDGSDINERLSKIESFVESRFSEMLDFPNPDMFKELCESFIKSGESVRTSDERNKAPRTLIAYIEQLAAESRSGKRKIARGPRKGQRFKEDSLKQYDSAVFNLKKFAEQEKVIDFPFRSVDEQFYNRFSDYFFNKLELSLGYFATQIKIIKIAMNESAAGNLHAYTGHNSRGFIKPEYESDTVSLDLKQLKQLQDHKFNEDEKNIEHARDLFLVGCWTGLRFEDFSTIRKQDIHKDFIRIRTDKTEGRVSIPFHPMLRKVFKRYGGGPPPPLHINYVNRDIKVACRLAKLKQLWTIRKNRSGVDVMEECELWRLISTHTARRSFASNMFRQGIPTLLIMAITGHKTEKAFLKYIRVGEEEKSRMMAEIWKQIKWE